MVASTPSPQKTPRLHGKFFGERRGDRQRAVREALHHGVRYCFILVDLSGNQFRAPHAIDATLSTYLRQLDGVEAHEVHATFLRKT